jgi:RNA polymerase sigma factor (sigma-70 family)
MTFALLPEHELHGLDDDALIAYIRDARDAGEPAASRTALGILVYGYAPLVRGRLALRVPSAVVEDLTSEVLVRAISGAFDGTSVGQFRAWLNTILDRTAVDHFRRAGRRVKEAPLTADAGDDDRPPPPEPAVQSESGAVQLRIVIHDVLQTFNPTHQAVIELHVFDQLTAAEVCDRIDGMKPDNVAQIASRFRARLRQELDAAGEAPA